MLMWILVTATACALVIWGAIDHWMARHDRKAPKRWPPVTVLSDDASLFVADGAAPIRLALGRAGRENFRRSIPIEGRSADRGVLRQDDSMPPVRTWIAADSTLTVSRDAFGYMEIYRIVPITEGGKEYFSVAVAEVAVPERRPTPHERETPVDRAKISSLSRREIAQVADP
jgi:hypothetical protein